MERAVAKFALGGEQFAVPVTLKTGMDIENALDCGVIELLGRLRDNKVRLTEAVTALRFALRNADAFDADAFEDQCLAAGVMGVMAALGEIIAQLFKGPEKTTGAGKRKAATASR